MPAPAGARSPSDWRGVARKPGGFEEPLFNLVMGPPLLAPGSLALVGGMGVAAAAFGRER